MKVIENPICDRCMEEEETTEHFLCRCPFYSKTRHEVFNYLFIPTAKIKDLKLKDILKFCGKTDRIT